MHVKLFHCTYGEYVASFISYIHFLDFNIKEKDSQLSKQNLAEPWFDFDMSPLRVWLEHSISPLIHVQYVNLKFSYSFLIKSFLKISISKSCIVELFF